MYFQQCAFSLLLVAETEREAPPANTEIKRASAPSALLDDQQFPQLHPFLPALENITKRTRELLYNITKRTRELPYYG
jgi:hypothetical protein